MKKIMFACAALLGMAVALGEKKSHHKYPAVFWSSASLNEFAENSEHVDHSTVA